VAALAVRISWLAKRNTEGAANRRARMTDVVKREITFCRNGLAQQNIRLLNQQEKRLIYEKAIEIAVTATG